MPRNAAMDLIRPARIHKEIGVLNLPGVIIKAIGDFADMQSEVSDTTRLTRFSDGRLLMVRFGGKGFDHLMIVNDDRTLCGQRSTMETFRRIRSHATRRGTRCWACFDMALSLQSEYPGTSRYANGEGT